MSSRLSIRVLVPSDMTAEDCEAFLRSPKKFMSERGGEVEFGMLTIAARHAPRIAKSKVHSFASPDTTERRS